uniref:DNA-directed RNA polymerase subunit n=1 Tax=Leptobrachium leishanense TaxID=445787 RepID=A0A8C5PWB8_9ANUR
MAEAQTVTESQGGQPEALSCLELPSFADASRLVKSRYSCLMVETHRRHLAISPKYLKRTRTGIQEQLSTELLRYNAGLTGVPVAYDNIKLVGEFADIYDDLGHIHINIQADFVIFRPDYGQKLVGVVNKVAPSHIGCLVHGCFNASVPKPFKMPLEAWQRLEVKMGDNMEFTVSRLDSDAVGVFCIRGRLDARMETLAMERINDVNDNKETEISDPAVDVPASNQVVLVTDTGTEGSPKKKGKKRKYQEILAQANQSETHVVSGDNSMLEETGVTSPNQLVETTKKEKRRKKHDTSMLDDNLPHAIVDTSLVPEEIKQSKKSKKKKHRDNLEAGVWFDLQNGVMGDSVITEIGASEESLPGPVHEKIKKKHKNKHNISFLTQDSDKNISIRSGNAEQCETSLEISREKAKKKKHKKKHQEHSLQGDDINREAESSFLELSLVEAEPKKKRKR